MSTTRYNNNLTYDVSKLVIRYKTSGGSWMQINGQAVDVTINRSVTQDTILTQPNASTATVTISKRFGADFLGALYGLTLQVLYDGQLMFQGIVRSTSTHKVVVGIDNLIGYETKIEARDQFADFIRRTLTNFPLPEETCAQRIRRIEIDLGHGAGFIRQGSMPKVLTAQAKYSGSAMDMLSRVALAAKARFYTSVTNVIRMKTNRAPVLVRFGIGHTDYSELFFSRDEDNYLGKVSATTPEDATRVTRRVGSGYVASMDFETDLEADELHDWVYGLSLEAKPPIMPSSLVTNDIDHLVIADLELTCPIRIDTDGSTYYGVVTEIEHVFSLSGYECTLQLANPKLFHYTLLDSDDEPDNDDPGDPPSNPTPGPGDGGPEGVPIDPLYDAYLLAFTEIEGAGPTYDYNFGDSAHFESTDLSATFDAALDAPRVDVGEVVFDYEITGTDTTNFHLRVFACLESERNELNPHGIAGPIMDIGYGEAAGTVGFTPPADVALVDDYFFTARVNKPSDGSGGALKEIGNSVALVLPTVTVDTEEMTVVNFFLGTDAPPIAAFQLEVEAGEHTVTHTGATYLTSKQINGSIGSIDNFIDQGTLGLTQEIDVVTGSVVAVYVSTYGEVQPTAISSDEDILALSPDQGGATADTAFSLYIGTAASSGTIDIDSASAGVSMSTSIVVINP